MDPLWVAGPLLGLGVGLAKTGVPGLGILVVPLMAMVIPDKQSVGTLLPLLLVADVFAIAYYRAHTDWKLILKLFPWVAAGFLPGALLLRGLDNDAFLPALGWLVLAMLGMDVLRQSGRFTHVPHHPIFGAFCGVLTGIATTVGNAAGPVMTVYLQARGYDKHRFMGSMAWLFFIINAAKVPLYLLLPGDAGGVAMINAETLRIDAVLAPFVIIGSFLGRPLLRRLPETLFRRVVLALVFLAALKLVF